jgi:magnesium transporter
MIQAFIKFGDGRISHDPDPANLVAALRDPQAIFWVDMVKPTDEEINLLDDVFGFHPLAIEDCIHYSQRPKIESYRHVGEQCVEGYFYMVIHGPDLTTFREKLRTKELDLFASARYLVTIHDDHMASISEMLQRADADTENLLSRGIDNLLHNILDRLVDAYVPILEYLQEALDELEDEATHQPTPALLTRISHKKRELLNLRRIIGPQREVLAQLTRGDVPFIRESVRVYFRDVLDHLVRAVETIELYRDLIIGTRDIYMSSVSNNLNRVMKTLTVITVIALPLNVTTGFFGMNFDHIPGLHSTASFWITVACMILSIIVMLIFFRIKKWV